MDPRGACSMDLAEWQRTGKSFRHREKAVFYHDEGPREAEVVLCIHGFPTASWDWHRLWIDLRPSFRLVAPDMLGYGFSDKPRRYRYSTFDQADLHEGLLRSLGLGRVHVLAHDYGDTVAQELLARHAERQAAGAAGLDLRSVCFLNGGLFPETYRIRLIQELLRSPIGFLIGRLMTERRFRASLSAVFGPDTKPSDAELRDFWKLVRVNGGRAVAHRLIRYVTERRKNRPRWVGALERTEVPLLLIDGAEDPVSGAHMAQRWREVLPGSEVVLLEGIGHYPQVEAPEKVLAAYRGFLEGNLRGRTTRAAASGVSGPPPRS